MRRVAEALYLIAIVLWVGGLWAIGYMVAPVLFASLGDRILAGRVAGQLFAMIGWLGLGCSAYLLVFVAIRQQLRCLKNPIFWLVLLMGGADCGKSVWLATPAGSAQG